MLRYSSKSPASVLSSLVLGRGFAAKTSSKVVEVIKNAKEGKLGGGLKGKHFMSIGQLSQKELLELIKHSIAMKKDFKKNEAKARAVKPLTGYTVSMIFQKRSTRTRVSTETGLFLLGAHGLMLGPDDVQLGKNETMKDTSKVLCRYNDIILARVFGHGDVVELAEHSSSPVINALSDKFHPLQTLADLMTLHEHFRGKLKGKTLTWVGDGNNVLNDLMIGAIKMGMNVRVATPGGSYETQEDVVAMAKSLAEEHKVELLFTTDPSVAATNSDVIVTDTWVSMGQEEEAKKRKRDFAGFQVNEEMFSLANKDAVFLHCLPRKPEEVTDEVFYSEKSLVFPEAENRMWTVMSVVLFQMGKKWKLTDAS